MIPAGFRAAFTAYRQNRNDLSPAQAATLASQFSDADWTYIDAEHGRWQSVSDRSSIAKDSLRIVEALKPYRPAAPVVAPEVEPDPSAVVDDLVTEAEAATTLSEALPPLGSAVRLIDGRVKALEER